MLKINNISIGELSFLNESFKKDPFWNYLLLKLKTNKQPYFVEFVFSLITKYNSHKYSIYATSNKLEGIMIVSDLSLTNPKQQGIASLFKYLYTMCGFFNAMFLFVLFMCEDIKCFIKLSKNTIKLEVLAVNSNYQNKGCGTKMLEYLLEICDKNSKKVFLETATEKNVIFYKKFGFNLKNKSKFGIDSYAFYMLRDYKK